MNHDHDDMNSWEPMGTDEGAHICSEHFPALGVSQEHTPLRVASPGEWVSNANTQYEVFRIYIKFMERGL
jgi:hypothetical protein